MRSYSGVNNSGDASSIVESSTVGMSLHCTPSQAAGVRTHSKLCVDSFLRVVGAEDLLALGDCSLVLGNRLPATAQVAGQQGAYLAHLINSGYTLGVGGYTQPPPYQVVKRRTNKIEVCAAFAFREQHG